MPLKRFAGRCWLICVFTGFTSGLPLYVLFQLIPGWLRTEVPVQGGSLVTLRFALWQTERAWHVRSWLSFPQAVRDLPGGEYRVMGDVIEAVDAGRRAQSVSARPHRLD